MCLKNKRITTSARSDRRRNWSGTFWGVSASIKMRLGGSPPASHHRPRPPRLPSARHRRLAVATDHAATKLPPSRSAHINRRLNNPSRSVPKPCSLSLPKPPFPPHYPSQLAYPSMVGQSPMLGLSGEEQSSAFTSIRLPPSLPTLPPISSPTRCLTTFCPRKPLTATTPSTQLLLTDLRFHFSCFAASRATCMLRTVGKPKILIKPSLARWSKVLIFS